MIGHAIDMDRYYGLLLGALGVWRITHAITVEDGPWDVFVRVRRALGGRGWGAVLLCFNCASVWVAVPFAAALASTVVEGVLLWLAVSGAACLLERLFANPAATPGPAVYWEEREVDHAVLRERAVESGSRADEH